MIYSFARVVCRVHTSLLRRVHSTIVERSEAWEDTDMHMNTDMYIYTRHIHVHIHVRVVVPSLVVCSASLLVGWVGLVCVWCRRFELCSCRFVVLW